MNKFTKSYLNPLNFAFDTNIVIGLINEEDRLHKDCLMLVNCADKIFLSRTVLVETISSFSKKALEVLTDVFQYAVISGSIESSDLLDYLNKKRPRYNNFNKYIARRAHELWEEYKDPYYVFERVSQMLVEIMDYEKLIDLISNEIIPKGKYLEIYKIDRKNQDDLSNSKKVLEELEKKNIQFKDNFDKEIFVETLISSSKMTENIIFVTDDDEFCKKATRALNVVESVNTSRLLIESLSNALQLC